MCCVLQRLIEESLEIDIHVHSVASGHAFATLHELQTQAEKTGMKVLGISDHGPSMDGAPHESYFNMASDIHCESKNCILLFGCEANIISVNGEIDIKDSTIEKVDYVLAGLHQFTPWPVKNSILENTKAIISCIEKSSVLAISHPITHQLPIEIIPVVEAAADKSVALEINARVFKNCNPDIISAQIKLIEYAQKYDVKLLLSSDSHTIGSLGKINSLNPLKDVLGESLELIVNLDVNTFFGRYTNLATKG